MTFAERLEQAITEVYAPMAGGALDPRTFFDVKIVGDRSRGNFIEVDWKAELKDSAPDFNKKRPIGASGVATIARAPGAKADVEVHDWIVGGVTIPRAQWHDVRGEWEHAIQKDVGSAALKLSLRKPAAKQAEEPPPLPKAASEEPPPLPARAGYPEDLRRRIERAFGEA